jgi:hypothetical protein
MRDGPELIRLALEPRRGSTVLALRPGAGRAGMGARLVVVAVFPGGPLAAKRFGTAVCDRFQRPEMASRPLGPARGPVWWARDADDRSQRKHERAARRRLMAAAASA